MKPIATSASLFAAGRGADRPTSEQRARTRDAITARLVVTVAAVGVERGVFSLLQGYTRLY